MGIAIHRHVCATLGTTLALGLVSLPSAAQTARDPAAAEALFNQAMELLESGRFPEACAKLGESQRLDPATGTLLHLGQCYEKTGRTASAWAAYKQAESAARETARIDRERIATARAAALEPNLSKLIIRVAQSADLPGVEVTRDGILIGRASWGSPVPVDPGTHVITATASGRKPWKREVQVPASGATTEIVIENLQAIQESPVAVPAAEMHPSSTLLQDATPLPDVDRGDTQRLAGLLVGSAGLVALGVGTWYGLQAKSKESSSKDHCLPEDPSRCYQKGVDLNGEAKDAALTANIAFLAGGLATGVGLALYLTAPSHDASDTRVGRVRISPALGTKVAGVAIDGTWR